MLIFPQLSTGAVAQYPITKEFSQRSIQSLMEDGTRIVAADQGSRFLRWRLAFRDLSDQEAQALTDLFVTAQGNLQPFLFLDPTANLLTWSEDFSKSVWNRAGLDLSPGVTDPLGSARATRVTNSAVSALTLSQITAIPGMVRSCFSCYLRSAQPVTVVLTRSAGPDTQDVSAPVTDNWRRFNLSGTFPASTDVSTFALAVPPGASIDVFGPQLDAQAVPSPYFRTAGPGAGVYPSARFDMPSLDVLATGPNRHACTILIRCNLPAGD